MSSQTKRASLSVPRLVAAAGTFILGFLSGAAICAAFLVALGFMADGALGSLLWLAVMLAVAVIAWTRGRHLTRRLRVSSLWLPAGLIAALLLGMFLFYLAAVMSSE
jgi:hypothetical protein